MLNSVVSLLALFCGTNNIVLWLRFATCKPSKYVFRYEWTLGVTGRTLCIHPLLPCTRVQRCCVWLYNGNIANLTVQLHNPTAWSQSLISCYTVIGVEHKTSLGGHENLLTIVAARVQQHQLKLFNIRLGSNYESFNRSSIKPLTDLLWFVGKSLNLLQTRYWPPLQRYFASPL